MNEEEFDSLMEWRPFGTEDAMRADARARRCTALGIALFGETAGDLHRQLLAPYPAIPSGFDLADFRELQKSNRGIETRLRDPRLGWLAFSPTVVVGTQHLTVWQARGEIIRRAIEYLENR